MYDTPSSGGSAGQQGESAGSRATGGAGRQGGLAAAAGTSPRRHAVRRQARVRAAHPRSHPAAAGDRGGGDIAAYYSVGTEPDTRSLIFALWKRGSYVVLPVLLGDGDLDWASYEGPDSLAPGPRGLLHPTEPVRGAGTVARADVVLVPALAVGRLQGTGSGEAADRMTARWRGWARRCR